MTALQKATYNQMLDRSFFDCALRQMKMGGQVMFYHRDSVVASIGDRLRTEILSWQAWPPGSAGESAGEAICAFVSGRSPDADRSPGADRGRLLAPSPENLMIPPSAPGSIRGKAITVRLNIDASGVVTDVEIIPSTGDAKFDGELKKVALGWRFRPARDSYNRPVATKFDVAFTF